MKLKYYSFNHDASCVTSSFKRGYSIHTIDPMESRYFEKDETIDVIRLLYCSPITILITNSTKSGLKYSKVTLKNTIKNSIVAERTIDNNITHCEWNKQRLILSFENYQLQIYELSTFTLLQTLTIDPQNYLSINSLSNEEKSLLAYPGSKMGEVLLHDTITLKMIGKIQAHHSKLVQIVLNTEGTMLATASLTGTMIRLFSIPDCTLLHTFRRGLSHIYITSISFCPISQFICVGSSSGNIHLFLVPSAYETIKSQISESHHYSSNSIPNYITTHTTTTNNHHPTQLAVATTSTSTTSPYQAMKTTNTIPLSPPIHNSKIASTTSTHTFNTSTNTTNTTANKDTSSSNTWSWKDAYQTIHTLTQQTVIQSTQFLTSSGLLPTPAQDYLNSSRAICIFTLPPQDMRGIDKHNTSITTTTTTTTTSSSRGISSNHGNDSSISLPYLYKAAIYRPTSLTNYTSNDDCFKIGVITENGILYRYKTPTFNELIACYERNNLYTKSEYQQTQIHMNHNERDMNILPTSISVTTWEDETTVCHEVETV